MLPLCGAIPPAGGGPSRHWGGGYFKGRATYQASPTTRAADRHVLVARAQVFVIEMSHFLGNPPEAARWQLADLVVDKLRHFMVPRWRGLGRTVGEMVATNERVLVTFEDRCVAAAHLLLWPSHTLHNTYADSDRLPQMQRYNADAVRGFNAGAFRPGALFKLSWTLTPQGTTIVESVLPDTPSSLEDLAARAHPALGPFADRVAAAGCRLGNILLVDMLQASSAVAVAARLNALPPSDNCTLSLLEGLDCDTPAGPGGGAAASACRSRG